MKKKKKVNKFLLNKFMQFGLHIGGVKRFFNPDTKVYLIGFRNNFGILALSSTHRNIRRVLRLLSMVVLSDRKILFIGSPVGFEKSFSSLCKKHGHYYLDQPTDGFFTNFGNNYSNDSETALFNERPSLVLFFDVLKYTKLKSDILTLNIPILAFVNTGDSLNGLDYLVPANICSWKGSVFIYNMFFYLFSLSKGLKLRKK